MFLFCIYIDAIEFQNNEYKKDMKIPTMTY